MERFFSLSNLGCDDLVEQFLKNLNVCNLFKVQREISHRNSKENEGEKKLYGENIIYKWMQQMYIYIYSKEDFEENTIDLRREIKTRNFWMQFYQLIRTE